MALAGKEHEQAALRSELERDIGPSLNTRETSKAVAHYEKILDFHVIS